MRRSTRDIRLGRSLTIGQTYRQRATGRDWTVKQIHRADCQVELQLVTLAPTPPRLLVRFAQLREQWDRVIPVDQLEALAA